MISLYFNSKAIQGFQNLLSELNVFTLNYLGFPSLSKLLTEFLNLSEFYSVEFIENSSFNSLIRYLLINPLFSIILMELLLTSKAL